MPMFWALVLLDGARQLNRGAPDHSVANVFESLFWGMCPATLSFVAIRHKDASRGVKVKTKGRARARVIEDPVSPQNRGPLITRPVRITRAREVLSSPEYP